MIVLLAPVLTPFLLSTLLAYLGDPLVDRLEEYGATRTLAVGIVFLGMFVLGICAVIVVLPALQSQATVLIQKIPTALEWMQSNLLPRVSSLLGGTPIEIDIPAVKETLVSHWQDVGSVAKNLMAHIGRSSQELIGWVTYLFLIPVVTFYLLRDWDLLVAEVHDLLPRAIEPRVAGLAKEIDDVLAEFLRGQLTVMAALAVVYIIGLWLVGDRIARLPSPQKLLRRDVSQFDLRPTRVITPCPQEPGPPQKQPRPQASATNPEIALRRQT